MPLSDVVSLSISIRSSRVTQAGFGTPLVLASAGAAVRAAYGQDLVRTYTEAADMLSDGWATDDAAYLLASTLKGQNPSPSQVKVAIRETNVQQIIHLTPTSYTAGHRYTGTFGGEDLSYIVLAADDSIAKVVVKLTAAINALGVSGLTATSAGGSGTETHTILTATSGLWVEMTGLCDLWTISDETAEPESGGAVDTMTALKVVDSDWYGVVQDAFSADCVEALADWIEANTRAIYSAYSADSAVSGSGSGDIGSGLKASSNARTGVWFGKDITCSNSATAILGQRLTATPGSDTWALKTVSLASYDTLTASQTGHLAGKNVNYYVPLGDSGCTMGGTVASGEYFDVIRFVDWLYARIQETTFLTLKSAEKVPFTDSGISSIEGAIRGVLKRGVEAGGLAATPVPWVTVPKAADVPSADRAARRLTGVRFGGTLAGAVHAVTISGSVSV